MALKDREARRAYHREYMRQYLAKPGNKEKHRKWRARTYQRYREKLQVILTKFRQDGCVVCG